jgi:hypothetical protein
VALAALLAMVFVVAERNVTWPMLPLHLLDNRVRRGALLTMLLMGGTLAAYVFFISFYVQLALGLSSLLTGLALVLSTATVMATSMLLTRRLLLKLGVRPVLVIGLVAVVCGQVWFARLGDGASYAVAVLPGLLAVSVGIGLVLPALTVAVTSGVDVAEEGSAGAVLISSQQIGSPAGLAMLATLAATRSAALDNSLTAGYDLAFAVAAAVAVVATVIVLVAFGASGVPARPTSTLRRASEWAQWHGVWGCGP